jgi:hypothetical protein
MENLSAATLLAAVVYNLTNTVKLLSANKIKAVGMQVLVFGVGILAVTLAAHSIYGGDIVIAGHSLAGTGWADQVLVGLIIASLAGVGHKALQALDASDTAQVPKGDVLTDG